MEDDTIIINKADKGSTIVVQDRDTYTQTGFDHLKDTTTYMELERDPTTTLIENINKALKEMHQNRQITKKQHNFLTPPHNARTPHIYFLKKIHKNPMSDRPIVSSCNSTTENISRFIDTYLQPVVKQLPSHIKDTKDFVQFIEALQIPKDTLLVTLDVSSLYTNIPHDEGTLYAKQAYSQTFVRHTHMPHTPMQSTN